MADYFIAETGAGAADGSSPTDPIAEASVTWAGRTADVNYLIGTLSSVVVDADGTSPTDKMDIRGNYPGYEATITNPSGNGLTIQGSNIKVTGLNITGCSSSGIRLVQGSDRDDIDLIEVISSNNTGKGITWPQTALFHLAGLLIDNCEINDNPGGGVFLTTTNTGAASYLRQVTITNTTILRNGGNNLKLGNSGIASKNHQDLIIDNCNVSHAIGVNGGTAIDGFVSSTGAHWKNYITNSHFDYNYGANGGLNILDCEYFKVFKNTANGNFAYQDSTLAVPTIDGNGILIDNGCDYIDAYSNECNDNLGNATYENSGAGLMMLTATNSNMHWNKGSNNRCGLYFGGIGAHTGSSISNNKFLSNTVYGFYVADPVTDNVALIYNNILTSNGTGTGFYRNTGVDQTNEDYNYFYNFLSDTNNHTLGTSSSTSDPVLGSDGVIAANSPCVGTGFKWWTGPNPESYSGKPFSDFDTDIGDAQTTYSPFHPVNL